MNILALESSATACSVALCEDEALIAQSFQNSGLTHSRTLMPMARQLLEGCGRTLEQVDVIAVASGPGSFTGLRIGIAAAKGLAWSADKLCARCSTLESMAWQLAHVDDAVIVAVMDARRQQVYNALFRARDGAPHRLCEDRAVSLEQVEQELKTLPGTKILVGDGARLCYNEWQGRVEGLCQAPVHLRWQTAWGVARAGLELARQDKLITGAQLNADYHRLSQAEREKLARAGTQQG